MSEHEQFPGWDKIIPALSKLPSQRMAIQLAPLTSYSLPQPNTMPPMYHVWLLKDDHTPMDFMMMVLKQFFHRHPDNAHHLALQANKEGQIICGLYTREVAESKVIQVIDFARAHEYPLKCVMRKEQPYAIKKS